MHSAMPADRTKGVRTYLYLNGQRVAVNNLYNTNHGQYYYGSDIVGSVKFVTGQAGQELNRIEYDIFGGIYKGASPYGLETGYTGVQKRHGCRWFRAETKFRKEAIAPF